MFSRNRALSLSLLIGFLFFQTACDRFLKAPEKDTSQPEDAETIVVQTSEVSCLKEAPLQLQKYFEDVNGKANLEAGIGCVQTSLKAFMKYTRGVNGDRYTTQEVQHFFNKFLLKENKISDNFQAEILKIKVLIVGGGSEYVTRDELNRFISFLDVLKIEGAKLQGQLQVLLFKQDKSKVTAKSLSELQILTQSVAETILAKSKVSESRYQWVDLISFTNELNKFVGQSKALAEILKWVPLAEGVKNLFIGENAKLVSEQEWKYALRWSLDTFFIGLKFSYVVKGHEFDQPTEWMDLVTWMDEIFAGIEKSPVMRDRKILEVKGLDRLIHEVYQLNLFSTSLSENLAKQTYRRILVHMLDGLPGGHGDPIAVSGLTEKHFRILRAEYHNWKLIQGFLNKTYSQKTPVNMNMLRAEAKKFNGSSKVWDLTKDPTEANDLAQGWSDFNFLINLKRPIVYNDQSLVAITYNPQEIVIPFVGANLMNFMHTWTRISIRGYGEHRSGQLSANSISEGSLVQLEEDFRDLGQAIGFLDWRSPSPARRTFKEGNLFTFVGNGDGWMSFAEIYEELNLLLSGGKTEINLVMEDLAKPANNCLIDKKDVVFNKPIANESCFYSAFRANQKNYLRNLPWMSAFLGSLTDKQYLEFYSNIMAPAYLPAPHHVNGLVEYGEMRTMTTILHYLEALMTVYDRDQNQMLSEDEVVAAEPRFHSFIASLSPLGDWFVEDIFLYLVYNGEKPTGITDLASWKAQRLLGLGQVGRLELVKVLGVLKKDAQ